MTLAVESLLFACSISTTGVLMFVAVTEYHVVGAKLGTRARGF